MRKVYIQPETEIYLVSQQTPLLSASGEAQIGIGDKANTDYDVETKEEADFLWN